VAVLGLFLGAVLLSSTGGAEALDIPEVGGDEVICFALYTVHDNILKLTAQLYPLKADEDRNVRLEVKEGRKWKQVA
jgi:hypothetical protein